MSLVIHPDFVTELLPYMNDPKIGIIQSPQYFYTDKNVHNRSALEYGAGHVQEDFYRFIQVARDRFHAPICCGSNAIYRRKALDTIGGTVQIEHSEDAYTGFTLTNKGWRVKYLPIILAVGLCPADLHAYFHQQHRWCSGSLSMMLSKLFWKSNLTFFQKLCYCCGFMYYLSHPVKIFFSFQIFFLLFLYTDSVHLINALPFLPCIFYSFLITPFFKITKTRYGGRLAQHAYMYSYAHAAAVAVVKQSVGWQPTNAKHTDVSVAYREVLHFVAVYFLVYITFVSFSIGIGSINPFNINAYSLLFWIIYTIVTVSIILTELYLTVHRIKRKQVHENKLKRAHYHFWQMKTWGGYISICLLLCIGFTELGSYLKGGIFSNITIAAVDVTKTPITIPEIHISQSQNTQLFEENLALYNENNQVLQLQQFLNENGFVLAKSGPGSKGNETHTFSSLTYRAVKIFQKAHHLKSTGELNSETREVVNNILNSTGK